MPREIAIFNIPRTIVDGPLTHALDDMEEVGLVTSLSESPPVSVREQQGLFLGAIEGRRYEELVPFLEMTADRAAGRLATLGIVLITAEVELGRDIGIYGNSLALPLVDAWAEGIRRVIPDANVTQTFGRIINTTTLGCFKSRDERLLQGLAMESLVNRGYEISLLADSFHSAMPAFIRARRKLLVNPDSEADRNVDTDIPRLYWSDDETDTRVQLPPNEDEFEYLFDLKDPADRAEFLELLGYTN